jgi:predicted RNA-binding Zn ribbon-like protein
VHPVVEPDGVRLASTARGVDGFLAALLAALVQGTIDGTFRRLKVCRSDTCQWTFYDSSKNGCGTWCSMRSCGARAKAKAYRERQRQDAGHEPAPADASVPAAPRTRRARLLRLPT